MPSTTMVTWPTLEEIEAISNCIGEDAGPMAQLVDFVERFDGLVNLDYAPAIVDGAPRLTFETLGALTHALAGLRFDLDYTAERVRALEKIRDAMALDLDESGRQAVTVDA